MSDEEKKAWKAAIKVARTHIDSGDGKPWDYAILAADAELTALRAALCRARDRDGMAAHIHKIAVDVELYAEGESVALLVANAAIDFIGEVALRALDAGKEGG